MAYLHGKGSVLYVSDGTSAAVRISGAADWTIDTDFDESPDPVIGDDWESRLKGLKRFTLSAKGNYDDAQNTLWTAMNSATSSKFYLYPNASAPTQYYYGKCWPKVSIDGAVTGKENFAMKAASDGQLSVN